MLGLDGVVPGCSEPAPVVQRQTQLGDERAGRVIALVLPRVTFSECESGK